jgi:type VI secretion system secreted protein VgrG
MRAFPAPASLGLFGTGLSQHARLLTLASSQQGGLPQSLVTERFSGHEAVTALFRFEVEALSTSTDLDPSSFIGEELSVALLQPDGGRRLAWPREQFTKSRIRSEFGRTLCIHGASG